MNGSKRKGTRAEHRSRRLLEAAGFSVTRAAGSLGEFDLVGVNGSCFVLVQVKCNRPPGPLERGALADFRCPANCQKLVHVWRDRQRQPDVIEL